MSRHRPLLRRALAAAALLGVAALVAVGLLSAEAPETAAQASPRRAEPRADIIDVHVHLSPTAVPRLLDVMQRRGISRIVNLSGGNPLAGLDAQLDAAARAPGKIVVFTTLAYEQARFPDYGQRMAELVRIAHDRGARGLKIAKVLGLALTTPSGRRIPVDDPALDPVFAAAGELGMPVAIHSGDPEAFWLPVDASNPRRDELEAHPAWALSGRKVPSFSGLLGELEARIARHPGTTFISVHFGNDAEHPDAVARMLRRYPNLYIDTAARIPELGRHSAAAMRAFFIEFQDRILYGSDLGVGPEPSPLFLGSQGRTPPTPAEIERFFDASRRYFETADRQFDHPTPIQGHWKIDGIALPPTVLAKVYHRNAARLLSLE
ncbi:MAG TPA: amidohydrolase family protein [Polyangiaceae bacterium]|nr:amidohydrolase family protein [Polyangiaceae bacterium]